MNRDFRLLSTGQTVVAAALVLLLGPLTRSRELPETA